MNVRLIKPVMSPPDEKHNQPPVEVPIIDTIRAWVREFQATRADKARRDLERISNPGKTS
jgi:hypothetical protein